VNVRVLVCGGRDFTDESFVTNALFRIDDERPITSLICGGAPGADTLAERTAKLLQVPRTVYRANWKRHGKAAGPIRNTRMLIEGKPDLVVAFPGGRGTADMVRQAKDYGVEVIEVSSGR
jgi:hypothetical protein